jgi:hypothetical protein
MLSIIGGGGFILEPQNGASTILELLLAKQNKTQKFAWRKTTKNVG